MIINFQIIIQDLMTKYLVMDVDGSLTDGKIYMGPDGESMKAFSIKDGMVPRFILGMEEIIPVVITARESKIVENRCREIGISEIYQGVFDKLSVLKRITNNNLGLCAFFGDDMFDLKCMLPIKEAGGIIGCPADAIQEVRAVCEYVCVNKAGEGALREFAEWLVSPKINGVEIERRVRMAREYICQLNVDKINAGIYEVNDFFWYHVQEYETKEEIFCQLESHRKYIDLQYMIDGAEKMMISDVARLKVEQIYDEKRDVIIWKKPLRMTEIILTKGNMITLYPENAHCGCINVGTNKVKKIVGKISIVM